MRSLLPTAVPTLFVFGVSSSALAQGGERVATVGWLAGGLEKRDASRVVEEQRMSERAGTMLGMGRTVGGQFPYARVTCPTAR